MARKRRTRLYSHYGRRVRFSDLPADAQHDLRSKWALKAAKTRSKARRVIEREQARVRRGVAREARQRLRVERTKLRAIEAQAKAQRKREREAQRALRKIEREVKRSAIEARKAERARKKAISDKERAIKRVAIEARKAERARKKAAREAERRKRAKSRAAKKGWKTRKENLKREREFFEPVKPNAKNQAVLMRASFERTKERVSAHFPPLHSHFMVRMVASGAVWGTLFISGLPPGMDRSNFLIDLESWVVIPKNQWLWITMGGKFHTEEAEPGAVKGGEANPYPKFRGMDMIRINPQKPGIGEPYMWLTAREILGRVAAKGKAPPDLIAVNLWWDKLGTKPKANSPLLRKK